MNRPTFDSFCAQVDAIYPKLKLYMHILKICFQNNDKLDRIASIVATKDRWFIESIKIYIFNCMFLLFF